MRGEQDQVMGFIVMRQTSVCVLISATYRVLKYSFNSQSEDIFVKWEHFGWSPQLHPTV